jgi:oxygen-independent coproporphyrinogen-3 oxidase
VAGGVPGVVGRALGGGAGSHQLVAASLGIGRRLAHGRRGGMATLRHKKPENWMSAVDRNGNGLQQEVPLQAEDKAREALLMGLRLGEGVDLARIAGLSGLPIGALVDDRAVDRMNDLGLVWRTGNRLHVSPAGMLLLDAILPEVVAV